MDCYLIEGQKVLYRISLALMRFFGRALKNNPAFSGSVKKLGLVGAFHKFATETPVSPGSLLDKSFRFRDFGRAKIQKYFLRIETDVKARGLSTAHGDRSRSDDNLPSAKALDDIKKVSDTLSYKQVSEATDDPKPHTHFKFDLIALDQDFAFKSISSCSLNAAFGNQGMSTPQPRHKAMAVFPIHHLQSAILSQKGVSTSAI